MSVTAPIQIHVTRDVKWTPRQREVLDLLVRNQTNGQIADALNISLDGAKWHVSEIITRLGVDSREEAAEYWRHENGLRMRFSRIASGFFTSSALKWGLGSAFVVGVVAVSAMVVVALRNTGGEDLDRGGSGTQTDGTPTASPSGTPPPTSPNPQPSTVPNATDEVIAGIKVSGLSFGAPGSLPVPLSVIIEKGCYQCDGPTSGFERVTLDSNGKPKVEQLFEPVSGYISASNWDPTGKTHFLSICSRGYCGGLGPISADAQTTINRSTDGGVTWQAIETVDGFVSVAAASVQGVLLNRTTYTDGKFDYKFQVMGTDKIVRPPEGAQPEMIDSRLIGWRMADGRTIQGLDGSALLKLPDLGTHPTKPYPVRIEGILPNGDALISWLHGDQPNKFQTYFGVSKKNGELASAFKGPGTLNIGSWLTQTIAFGNVTVPNPDGSDPGAPLYPAMIDFAAAKVNVLELYGPFGDKTYQGQRNRIQLVEPGPFLRVTGAGDCLNVRETASTSAKTFGCYADNVLLRDLAGEEKSGNVTWKKVGIPGGQQGWASAAFLAK